MKKLGRMACLAMVAVIAVPFWTTTAKAQLPAPVYPVVHDKAWYDNPENVAPFTWTDEQGVQHENKVSDLATNPLHIIALLSYVYTNPKIPGVKYAIPDSAGMENIYRYIPSVHKMNGQLIDENGDFDYDGQNQYGPTWQGYAVRTNNLDTKVDYSRRVRSGLYTGDVLPEDWNYNYEHSLDCNRNGLLAWTVGNPYFSNKDGNGEVIVEDPIEHGLTIFLVKMKDSYLYGLNNGTVKPTIVQNTSDLTPSQYGVSQTLYNSINSEIESVQLITNSVRIEDAESKANYNSGTLFSVDEPNMNRFYFIGKGKPRMTIKMPMAPLFEEFSPISSLLNGWEMDFYDQLMNGKIFTMQHDCSSVPEQAHAFSMHGLQYQGDEAASHHRDVEGVNLWIPDYRMKYWEYGKGEFENYLPAPREGFGRDLYKAYHNRQNSDERVWRVIRYFNYNPLHAPSLALYTCQLDADAQPYQGTVEGIEHPYNVKLDWSTTVSRIAGSNNAIPEDFEVYRVVNGVREPVPLFTFVYGQDGYCQVKTTPADIANGESPSSMSRYFEHNYQVPQHEDYGYWITYQVFTRVSKPDGNGGAGEVFNQVYSNLDRVWIPPYEGTGAIKLNLEVNTSSVYDREKEVNRYVNTINIINNPGNPLKMGDVFMRPNNQGWNPDHVNGNGMPNGGFESNTGSPSWQWQDNNMGSEIIVYRFETSTPSVKTPVARVYFNCLADGSRFRFAVGRRNQAESATEGEYIYTNDDLDGVENSNARPWMQSCDASGYSAQDDFPFNNNHGYALGTTSKTEAPDYDYTKGLMVTDVFEASTASNEHPAQYGYIAEFNKYSNPNAATWGYTNIEYRSNQVTVDVYKSNSESYEHTFTKDEIDNGDKMHELEVGYKAGLTVNNMLYDPEIVRYDLYTKGSDAPVGSYAKRDTPNNYLVYANGERITDPSQFQSVVTIPDNSREADNLHNVKYVPVITAVLPERANWMTGNGTTTASSTYGSDFHGTGNTIVELAYDKKHLLYEAIYRAYLASLGLDSADEIAEADWCYGSDIEHTLITNGAENNGDWYGHFMTISSDMSPNLEVYGVRVWRVRKKDANGAPEDKLVNEWFQGDDMSIIGTAMPSYFVVAVDKAGKLSVELKDIYKGPDMETFKQNTDYQPKYIVHYYGRVKSLEEPTSGDVNTLSVTPRAQDDQAKVYYVSEFEYHPTINDIPTGINGVMQSVQVESVEYIDVMGRVSSRPFKGLNIVVTRYADGTIITTKQVKN